MADIIVAGNTSGAITISAPLVAGSGTLTLPVATDTLVGKATTDTLTNKSIAATQLTGTIAAAALPAGSVLQVVQTVVTGANTTTSTSFVTTNQSATITPTRNTSKILITVNGTNYTNNADAAFTVYRGATNLGGGSAPGLLYNHGVDWGTIAINYLDSPATTSPTTYTVYFKITSGTCYFNNAAVTSTITLMEIAG